MCVRASLVRTRSKELILRSLLDILIVVGPPSVVVIHYLKIKVGVVDFANAQGLVMF